MSPSRAARGNAGPGSRWVAGAVVSLLATTVLATAGPTAVVRAASPYPIREVWLPFQSYLALDSVTDVSPDGRFATIVTGGRPYHLALPSGAQAVETHLAGFRADSGGVFAYRLADRDTVQVLRVEDGTITEFDVPASPFGDVGDIVDIDASGRVFLFTGALYDSVSGEFEPFVSSDPLESPPSGVALSDDGRYVTRRVSDFAGGISTRTVTQRYDRTGSTRPVIASPSSADDPYGVSPSLEWLITFSGSTPGPGVGPTVIREHVPTGTVDVVPVDAALVRGFNVDDDGRVVVSHVVPTAANPGAVQLSLWTGSGSLVLLTQGVDGEPADLGIERSTRGELIAPVEVSRDGGRVTFTSLSTNLVASATTIERRLFQIVLPPVQRESLGSRLLPDQSICVPAIGAAPGEYVGVNVTAVGATASGYGVLHSSDERAGATSTVNFAPGTVDPNVGFVRVGADGQVCFTNSRHGPVDVVLDAMTLAGATVFGASDLFSFPPLPRRALDTRVDDSAVQPGAQDCRASVLTPLVPGEPQEDVVIGVNTTPVGAVAPGYGTVHTYLMSPGAASTVNFGPGTVDPNFSFVKTFSSRICFTNSQGGQVHVVIDQLVADREHALRTPPMGADGGRPVDTRTGVGGTRLSPSGSVCFAVAGAVAGEFVGVNVTPVGAAAPGFGTLHPSGGAPGRVSNVNFGPGTVDPNFAMTRVGDDGRVCFTNSVHGEVDVVIDAQVIGDADAFRLPSADGSVRILDTREARP